MRNEALRAVLFVDELGRWGGVVLEHAIAAHGETPADVEAKLRYLVEAHLLIAEERGEDPTEALGRVPPSSKRYWRMYDEAASVEELGEAARERRLVKVPDVLRWAPWAQGRLGFAPA